MRALGPRMRKGLAFRSLGGAAMSDVNRQRSEEIERIHGLLDKLAARHDLPATEKMQRWAFLLSRLLELQEELIDGSGGAAET